MFLKTKAKSEFCTQKSFAVLRSNLIKLRFSDVMNGSRSRQPLSGFSGSTERVGALKADG